MLGILLCGIGGFMVGLYSMRVIVDRNYGALPLMILGLLITIVGFILP